MINPFHNYELKLSLKGICSIIIPAGQTVSHTYNVTENIWMTGAEYFRYGNDSDQVSFKIKLNGETVSTPADNLFMSEHGRYEFYKATLAPGMSVEITYKNNGVDNATFRYNIISHKEG